MDNESKIEMHEDELSVEVEHSNGLEDADIESTEVSSP